MEYADFDRRTLRYYDRRGCSRLDRVCVCYAVVAQEKKRDGEDGQRQKAENSGNQELSPPRTRAGRWVIQTGQ